MRMYRKAMVGAVAAAATVGLTLAGTAAQAQTTHLRSGPLTATPNAVPAGIVTAVNLTNPCPSGTKPSSVKGFPAPDGATTDVQALLAKAPNAVRLAGVWPGPAKTYNVKVSCPGGQSGTSAVKVEAAPKPTDVVGVGSDTIQNVMDAFSGDYDASHTGSHLYSWDATNPITGAIGDNITTKSGCTAIPRPDGSGAGVTALTTENGTTGGNPCIDFARSSAARSSTNPTTITFVTLAGDAVTYATQPGSHAPKSLTTAQLAGIYNCTITNWSQVGGTAGKIAPFIPQPSSGTRAFFLAAIGVTTPGSCVSDDNGNLEENEGVNPVLNTDKSNVIFPFSVGKYIAERYHSAACFNSSCTPNSAGIECTPAGENNLFGCDTRGTMMLDEINGTAPTTPFPLTNTSKNPVINPGFTSTFQRFLFEVVNSPEFSIPGYLQPFFSSTGWVCTSKTAKTDLKDYGFEVLPAGTALGDCGNLS